MKKPYVHKEFRRAIRSLMDDYRTDVSGGNGCPLCPTAVRLIDELELDVDETRDAYFCQVCPHVTAPWLPDVEITPHLVSQFECTRTQLRTAKHLGLEVYLTYSEMRGSTVGLEDDDPHVLQRVNYAERLSYWWRLMDQQD